jgi:hypothetical protein
LLHIAGTMCTRLLPRRGLSLSPAPRPAPRSWFDLVAVLQADNSVLYDRLEKRGYAAHKVGSAAG